ncbi:MAG: hypothetical protein V3V01_20580, partial [Acidimicrobiales bacterium]
MNRRSSAVTLVWVILVVGCSSNAALAPTTTDSPAPTLPIFDDDRTDLNPGPAPESIQAGLVES